MNRIDDPIAALGALDPIDAPALIADWTATAASAALLDALPGLEQERPPIVRRIRRNRRWIRTAAAAGVAASAVTGLVLVGLPGSTPRAYGIRELQDGKIVIDWMTIRGRAAVEDLQDYGLDITVSEEEHASPSLIGEVVPHSPVGGPNDAHPDQLPPGIEIGQPGSEQAFTWTIDPAVFDIPLTVSLYVATEPGRNYDVSESPFAAGEALAGDRCALTNPLTPAQARDLAEAGGYTVTWSVDTPSEYDADGWGSTFRPSSTMPEGTVVGDWQINDHSVQFTVRPDGDWPAMIQESDEAYVAHLQEGC